MRLITIMAMLVLATVLAVQNASPVTVVLLLWRAEASLAVVIVLCFASGALAAALMFAPAAFRRHSETRRLRKRVVELELHSGAKDDETPP